MTSKDRRENDRDHLYGKAYRIHIMYRESILGFSLSEDSSKLTDSDVIAVHKIIHIADESII